MSRGQVAITAWAVYEAYMKPSLPYKRLSLGTVLAYRMLGHNHLNELAEFMGITCEDVWRLNLNESRLLFSQTQSSWVIIEFRELALLSSDVHSLGGKVVSIRVPFQSMRCNMFHIEAGTPELQKATLLYGSNVLMKQSERRRTKTLRPRDSDYGVHVV